MSVEVRGLRETIKKFEKLGAEVSDLKAAFVKIGTAVAEEAKSLAPAKTGRLANSIKPSKTKNKSVVRAGGARVPYAGVQNYGGYNNISAKHFLDGAVENKQDESIRTLEEELARIARSLGLT